MTLTWRGQIDPQVAGSIIVHRVNIDDTDRAARLPAVPSLVGSKSGIAVLDSRRSELLLPPGSSAEVDFFLFQGARGVVTHANPDLDKLQLYPSVDDFLGAWHAKCALEDSRGVPRGLLLANLKTHGEEEHFIRRCQAAGLSTREVVFLDQEMPATDRLLRAYRPEGVAPVALRLSRIESLESVLQTLRQPEIFAAPRAIFYDPVGAEDPKTPWPFERAAVLEMYTLLPTIEFYLCCPSRWGQASTIQALAQRLQQSGLHQPRVMTDLALVATWAPLLSGWKSHA